MEQMMQIAGLCATGALLVLTVKGKTPEIALLLSISTVVAVLIFLIGNALELSAFFQNLAEKSGIAAELLIPLYKTVGIALIVKIGGSLCADAGVHSLAAVLDISGAICALLVSLPLFKSVASLLLKLL